MPSVLIFMLTGILLGRCLRHHTFLHQTEKTISITVLLLLFTFGLHIGTNESLLRNFGNVGLQSLILAIAGLSGSILISGLTYLIFFKKEERHEK